MCVFCEQTNENKPKGTLLFSCFSIHLTHTHTHHKFFVQASGFLGDSYLPIETIIKTACMEHFTFGFKWS